MEELTLNNIIAIATSLGVIISTITIIYGVKEYRRQVRRQRVEFYLQMDKAFNSNPTLKRIRSLLFVNDAKAKEELLNIQKIDKNDYAGFFENIAILTSNKLLSIKVVAYMFGLDMIRCESSKEFWQPFIGDEESWHEFRKFVKKIRNVRKASISKSIC